MNTDAIFNAAQTLAIKMLESGAYVSPADTVCALEAASGRIYTGISRTDMNIAVHAEVDAVRNMLASGESTIRGLLLISTQSRTPLLPCNQCLGYILSLSPENGGCMIMMPDRMINIYDVCMFAAPMGNPAPAPFMGNAMPRNTHAAPVVPNVPIPPVMPEPVNTPVSSEPVSTPVTPEPVSNPVAAEPVRPAASENSVSVQEADLATNMQNATGDLLKGKVSSLLKVAADDDTDEFLDSLPTKKKRFGLFKK
ncbi:cytidine deaminase [Ruminococcus flavefaciens]|uniref:Uncharacterized protein n=1 Tax=Ruminococcus flavefaciens 007c TaxID=1341157 RepID=W7V1C2_RUMFL|nr:cytidine deaminase [Ruminococcus flavefaciens]EWM54780.1 hypothetical protein RF007C_10605 [Ruminococcus flavefaciens 007c]